MRRTVLPLLLAALCLGFAPAPLARPDPSESDLKAMQGAWTRTKLCINGSVYEGKVTFLVKRGKLLLPPGEEWDLTLDAKADPKRVKAVGTAGDLKGVTMEGVYRLKKDELTLCWRQTGQPMKVPVARFDEPGKGVWLYTLQRQKR